ncbi:MAG: hypothetical protein V7754_08990 [Halioglobus sp.]
MPTLRALRGLSIAVVALYLSVLSVALFAAPFPTVTWDAKFQEDEQRVKVKLKIEGLKQSAGFDLVDSSIGVSLAQADAAPGDKNLTLLVRDNIPCEVRLDGTISAEITPAQQSVKNAPAYCNQEGLSATLTGTVLYAAGKPLAKAIVSTEIEGFRFTTQADQDGRYTLTVRGTSATSYVQLSAQGSGEQAYVQLRSLVGELGELVTSDSVASLDFSLFDWAVEVGTSVTQWFVPMAYAQSSELLETTISNITTALVAILTQANGDLEFIDTAQIDILIANTDPLQILQVAAIISLVADPESGLELPEGSSFEDIVNPETGVLDELVVEVDESPALQTQVYEEVQEIIQDPELFPSFEFAAETIIGQRFEARVGNVGADDPAAIVTFIEDVPGSGAGTGTRLDDFSEQGFTWSVSGIPAVLTVEYGAPDFNAFLRPIPLDPAAALDAPITDKRPLLYRSEYVPLALAGGSISFSVTHYWKYPGAAAGEDFQTLADMSSLVEAEALLDPVSELGIDTLEATFGMVVGADVFNLEALGRRTPGGRLLRATGIDFNTDGSGSIHAGDVTEAGLMAWSVTDDGKGLEVRRVATDPGAPADDELVTFWLLQRFGEAHQAIARLDRADGVSLVVPLAIIPATSQGFSVGEEVGRFEYYRGPVSNTSVVYALQFDDNGTGRQEYYPRGYTEDACNDIQVDPFTWELDGDGELRASFYREIADGAPRLANCPPLVEGVTCFELRKSLFTRLNHDDNYEYTRLYSEFNLVGGVPWAGPLSSLLIMERTDPIDTPCGLSFDDAPVSPYAGSYTVSPDTSALDTSLLSVDDGGNVIWNFTVDTVVDAEGVPIPLSVTGTITPDATFQSNLGGPDGLEISFRFTSSDSLLIEWVNDQGQPVTVFGTREGETASTHMGSYTLAVDPANITTRQFVVDSAGIVRWRFDALGATNVILERKLDPSGIAFWADFFGYDVTLTVTAPGYFTVEVVEIDTGAATYGFGSQFGYPVSSYVGLFDVQQHPLLATTSLMIDASGYVKWWFTTSAAPGGPYLKEGQLTANGSIAWNDLGVWTAQLRFVDADYLALELSDTATSDTMLTLSGNREGVPPASVYTGSFDVSSADGFQTLSFNVTPYGEVQWSFNALGAADPFNLNAQLVDGVLNYTGWQGQGFLFDIVFQDSNYFVVDVRDINNQVSNRYHGTRAGMSTNPYFGEFDVAANIPGGADLITVNFSVDPYGWLNWSFFAPAFSSTAPFNVGGRLSEEGTTTGALPGFNFDFAFNPQGRVDIIVTDITAGTTTSYTATPRQQPAIKDRIGLLGGDACSAEALGASPLGSVPSGLTAVPSSTIVYQDLAYGAHERQKLDVFLPPVGTEPTGLIIHIHGGGFTGGEKAMNYADGSGINDYLQEGVAYASINYPLISGSGTSVIDSLEGASRSVQFLRCHASKLNIDPARVGVTGGSAGAGTSLWLGTHDDLAQLDSAEPVEQQSTRVSAVYAVAAQATYDLVRWEEVLKPALDVFILDGEIDSTAQAEWQNVPQVLGFYDISDLATQFTPDMLAYRGNVDMLGMMDANDAPFCANSGAAETQPAFADWDNLHEPLHAIALKQRSLEVGLPSVVHASGPFQTYHDSETCGIDFMLNYLQ